MMLFMFPGQEGASKWDTVILVCSTQNCQAQSHISPHRQLIRYLCTVVIPSQSYQLNVQVVLKLTVTLWLPN